VLRGKGSGGQAGLPLLRKLQAQYGKGLCSPLQAVHWAETKKLGGKI